MKHIFTNQSEYEPNVNIHDYSLGKELTYVVHRNGYCWLLLYGVYPACVVLHSENWRLEVSNEGNL